MSNTLAEMVSEVTIRNVNRELICHSLRCENVLKVKGNGDHSEVRDKFCSNFQNMLIRSL